MVPVAVQPEPVPVVIRGGEVPFCFNRMRSNRMHRLASRRP
jgi:hypothetical protein